MNNDVMSLQEEIPVLRHFIEQAEFRRDEQSLDVLRKYMGLQLGALLPLTSTMTQGIFEQIIAYLGAADEETKHLLRQRYTALWELFLRENKAGVVGILLAREITLSFM